MLPGDDLVNRIVEQLNRNGPLNDPRHLEAQAAPLEDYCKEEVRKSIKRLPLGLDLRVTTGQARQLSRLLRNHDPGRSLMYTRHAQRGAPDRGDPLKLRCAEEAYFLADMFSPEPPTGTEGGPYLMIAALLLEAATGEREGDKGAAMKRPCAQWLRFRRQFPNNNPDVR